MLAGVYIAPIVKDSIPSIRVTKNKNLIVEYEQIWGSKIITVFYSSQIIKMEHNYT